MLRLVTLPPTMHPGRYLVERVTHEVAAEMIREADRLKELESYITFRATAVAVRGLAGIPVRTVRDVRLPPPEDGDVYLHVRLAGAHQPGRQIGLADLAFFEIVFEETKGE